ncbi:hypothetical protein ACFODZ_08000 [Marinicella sediminis]|uniref:Uncharacterized protein n=1 Tax=Marinicella sediminis TaxID=1792834 RepID=A0ABV7JDN1_9GAMM|nr:hypothetical protein [Marinicella sediminis]
MTLDQQAKINHTYDGHQLAEQYFEALSGFFFEMDINGQKFVESFVAAYIKHVDAETNRVSDVIMNTGFTKTVIENTLKGVKKNRQFAIKSFFGEMIEEVKKICSRNEQMTMKIKGTQRSFTSVFYRLEPSTKQLTSQSFLDYMIKRGIIERVDDNTIRFVRAVPINHVNTKEKMLSLFTNVMERFTQTLIGNYQATKPADENFQQTYRSWHIDPQMHNEARQALKKLLRTQWLEIQQLIDSYEVKTEFEKNRVEQSGAELGVSTFVYHNNPNEE